MTDPINDLRKLAGIGQTRAPKGESDFGAEMTMNAQEKREYERKHNIKPGTPEWMQLWFSKPYLTGETPFRGRKKS